eukprot:50922_1
MTTSFLFTAILTFTIKGETIHCDAKGSICICDSSITGETCYLDCAREDACKDAQIQCRQDDPCVIDCTGEDGCASNAKIIGTGATEVTIICGDESSCKGNTEIYCGVGHCHIVCIQDDSCQDTLIYANTASSFQCLPASYCQEADIISVSTESINLSPSAENSDISDLNVSAEDTNANPSIDNPDTDANVLDDAASFDSTPETQAYGVMDNKHKAQGEVVPSLWIGIIVFVAIATAAISGFCYWRKLKYKEAFKDVMIEYGSLSSI